MRPARRAKCPEGTQASQLVFDGQQDKIQNSESLAPGVFRASVARGQDRAHILETAASRIGFVEPWSASCTTSPSRSNVGNNLPHNNERCYKLIATKQRRLSH